MVVVLTQKFQTVIRVASTQFTQLSYFIQYMWRRSYK